MFVVRFPNQRYMKHGAVFVPKSWSDLSSEYTQPWHVEFWEKQIITHTTTELNEARTFSNINIANAAVKRAGYKDFDILPVTLTLVM